VQRVVVALVAHGDDFASFRGPDGLGVTANQAIPEAWSDTENLAWKVTVPGSGWSQPIVVGDRIFVTAAVAEKDLRPKNLSDGVKTPQSMGVTLFSKAPDVTIEWQVLCLNAADGNVLWSKVVHSGKPRFPVHPSNTFATESPVADAKGVACCRKQHSQMLRRQHRQHAVSKSTVEADHGHGESSDRRRQTSAHR